VSSLDPEAIAALRDLNPGDDSFLRDLIQIYLADSPQRIAEIEEALAQGDSRKLTVAAHSLKGSSANFGATALRAVSEAMELLGKREAVAEAGGHLPALKEEYARVAAELEGLLGAP
jgi:histidine phosphotransfer protein HptB